MHPQTTKRLKKGGVHQVVRATNLVVFAMSKESGSAAYDHTVLEDVMSILKTGRLSDGSRAEAFINQTRIPGGERDDRKYPLPSGLCNQLSPGDATTEMLQLGFSHPGSNDSVPMTYEEICKFDDGLGTNDAGSLHINRTTGGEEYTAVVALNDSTKKDTVSEPVLTAQQKNLKNKMKEIKTRYERPLFGDVRRIRRRRDGCAAQYQGRKAFRGWQSLKARTGCDLCEDCRNTKNHGKCTCDGLGHALKTNIYRLADDDYGPGTRNLLRQLALRFPGPRKSRQTRYAKTCVSRGGGNVGILSPDSYLYIFYPSDSFKTELVDAKKGYEQSSKDHYYQSKGADANDCSFLRREMVCTCYPCLLGSFNDCLLQRRFVDKATEMRISASTKLSEVVIRGGTLLEDFCERLKKGDNVVVRIAREDRGKNPDENYFIARLLEKPHQLQKGGTDGTNRFNAGWYVAQIQWYNFFKCDQRGSRFYKLGEKQKMSCGTFVRGLTRGVKLIYERNSRAYKLDQIMDAYILEYGSLID